MTWREWVESDYNPYDEEDTNVKKFIIDFRENISAWYGQDVDDYIVDVYIDSSFENIVYSSDIIIAGGEYYTG